MDEGCEGDSFDRHRFRFRLGRWTRNPRYWRMCDLSITSTVSVLIRIGFLSPHNSTSSACVSPGRGRRRKDFRPGSKCFCFQKDGGETEKGGLLSEEILRTKSRVCRCGP